MNQISDVKLDFKMIQNPKILYLKEKKNKSNNKDYNFLLTKIEKFEYDSNINLHENKVYEEKKLQYLE